MKRTKSGRNEEKLSKPGKQLGSQEEELVQIQLSTDTLHQQPHIHLPMAESSQKNEIKKKRYQIVKKLIHYKSYLKENIKAH